MQTQPPRLNREVVAPLRAAVQEVERTLEARPTDSTQSAQAAVIAGYLERLHLGLSNPFRLAEYALADTHLTVSQRRGVAWLLIRRAYVGDAYTLPTGAIAGALPDGVSAATVRAHADLIERAVSDAAHPLAGETAVRVAYQLAALERTIPPGMARTATRLASLVRDRELARRDARELLEAARRSRADPVSLVPSWRASLRLEVERPVWERTQWQAQAVAASHRWLLGIRAIATDSLRDSSVAEAGAAYGSRLTPQQAQRLLALAPFRAPPQAPVIVATRQHARQTLGSTNEETLVAELALLPMHARTTASAALLDAAVGLRSFAQERVWMPGQPTPTVAELRSRFGYAAIEFDADVPRRWRGYLLHALAVATAELRGALPGLSLDGTRIRFVARVPQDSLLALHLAHSRTVILPLTSAAGTLAHELAHDLDARAGRLVYGRSGYATDLAVRRQDSRMAASVAGLAGGTLPTRSAATDMRHRQRPAEVFARAVEWVVPALLAREGRMNGYLSSVQDEMLTGTGSISPADITYGAAPALADVLTEMRTRDARSAATQIRSLMARNEWTVSRLMRLVQDIRFPGNAAATGSAQWNFRDPVGSLVTVLPVQPPACAPALRSEGEWRDNLIRAVIDARLRGYARRRSVMGAFPGNSPLARLAGHPGPWHDRADEAAIEAVRQRLLSAAYERIDGKHTAGAVGAGAPFCARG